MLSAASLAAQGHADVVTHSREPLSLWHVTVGDSGERKSGADRWALQAHREVEREAADAHRLGMATYEVALTAHKAASRNAEKGKDAEAILANLTRLGPPPEPPLSPLLLVPEATLEGLHKLYQSGRPSLGLFNDDAGDFLDGHAMNRDNRTKSAAGFSKLWDSGEFSRIRAGDGAAKFYGRRLAMHVMVQPVIAERVLSDDVLCGQGFLPRCLVAWPASTVGTRMFKDVDLSRDPALLRYWSRMRDLLTEAMPLRDGSRNELEARALVLSPDAKALWIDAHNAIERDMAGEFASVRAWASKAASQVARIAGVLTLVEEPGAGVIRVETVDRAARLAMYHLREAARVVGTASVPAKVRHAEALLAWCRETDRTLLYSR
ncbi:MAG: YfjI family protein, partial [Pseudomonadota bacterium]|nr:YfjI family protein [Pseudomonadota bacterium]